MAYSISPALGVDLSFVGANTYNETGAPTPAVGTVVKGSDGHDYVFAKASAAVASGAVVVLTEPAMTFATGAGAWTAPTITGGVPINNYAWLKKTTI